MTIPKADKPSGFLIPLLLFSLSVAVLIISFIIEPHGRVYWVHSGPLSNLSHRTLVCYSTGLNIAYILGNEDGPWSVFGGNGSSYGTFQTEDQAKKQAESIVNNGWSLRMGAKWMTCPADALEGK